MRREIDPRIAAGTGSMTGEKADDDERKDDGGSRTKQIKRKRQRQVVSLAKAMRAGRDSRYAEPDKSDAKCESRWLPRIDLNSGQRQVLMCMTADACSLFVEVEWKPSRCVGRKSEFANGAWCHALFDVITVKMQDERPVARTS